MSSNEHLAIAQRSEDLHDTAVVLEIFDGFMLIKGLGFPSQSLHSKGAQGNQTRSLPVSMYRVIGCGGSERRLKERV